MSLTSKLIKCSKIKGLRALIGFLTKAQPSMGNNPMVGATVAVAVENASKYGKIMAFTELSQR